MIDWWEHMKESVAADLTTMGHATEERNSSLLQQETCSEGRVSVKRMVLNLAYLS